MRHFIFILISLAFIQTTYCEASETEQSKATRQFKSFLQDIKHVAMDFTQLDSKGTHATGKLLISKPHKFRCNYYAPYPILIVGNKNYISVYDFQMEQISRIKSAENLFNFLLIDNLDFDKYFSIAETNEDGQNMEVTIIHKESERRSTIIFSKATKFINSIEIFEDDNIITLKLSNLKQVAKFDEDLFIIKNPEISKPPVQYSKQEIEKKYQIAP